MTAQFLDDQEAKPLPATEPKRRRWGFNSQEQAGETLAEVACIALWLGFFGWLAWRAFS